MTPKVALQAVRALIAWQASLCKPDDQSDFTRGARGALEALDQELRGACGPLARPGDLPRLVASWTERSKGLVK